MAADDEERRVGMATLEAKIDALVTSHHELKETVRELALALAAAERRANDACKTCTMWDRMRTVETAMAAMKGEARGFAFAMSALAGALSFLASWFVRR